MIKEQKMTKEAKNRVHTPPSVPTPPSPPKGGDVRRVVVTSKGVNVQRAVSTSKGKHICNSSANIQYPHPYTPTVPNIPPFGGAWGGGAGAGIAGNPLTFTCSLYALDSSNVKTLVDLSHFPDCIIAFYWGGTKKLLIRKPDYQLIDGRIVFRLDGNQTRPIYGECHIEVKLITAEGNELNGEITQSFYVKNLSISQEKP